MNLNLKSSILHILLDDIESLNALTLDKTKALQKNLTAKVNLILCGAEGRVFCSGGNLKEYAQLKTKKQGVEINRQIRANLQKLARHKALKVALIKGDCIGGGIEFMSCFDIVVAQSHVLFSFWQNKQKLSFGWGGYQRLSTKVSSVELKKSLLLEETKTAQEMKELGLIQALMSEHEMLLFEKKLQNLFIDQDSKIEILKSIDKNEVKLFEKLWWSKEHLQKLKGR